MEIANEQLNNLSSLPIGRDFEWKFGLITRNICRVSNDRIEIDDTSNGWVKATVSLKTMAKIVNGEKSLNSLNWV